MHVHVQVACALLVSVMDLLHVSRAAADSSKTGVIPIARCRSRCLAKFLKSVVGDQECQENQKCQTCWNVCETIFSNDVVWRETCKKRDFCKRGCQVACQFWRNLPKITVSERLQFSEIPAVTPEPKFRKAYMAWNQPVLKNSLPDATSETNKYLVYVLLFRDVTKKYRAGWQQTLQTASTTAILELSSLPYSPEFWLLAVGQYGTVAEVRFNSSISQHQPFKAQSFEVPGRFESRHGNGVAVKYDPDSTLTNLTFDMKTLDGRLIPTVTWMNPAVLPTRQKGPLLYRVDLYLNNCECELPSDHFASTVEAGIMQKPKYVFNDIAYNAEYMVEITLLSDAQWQAVLTFYTPHCSRRDAVDPAKCNSPTVMDTTLIEKTKKTTPSPLPITTPITSMVNTSKGMGPDMIVYTPGSNHGLDWNITVVDKAYHTTSHHVFVTLRWAMPFNNTRVTQELVWTNLKQRDHLDAGRMPHTPTSDDSASEVLKLKPNNVYHIYVAASYTDNNNNEREFRSNDIYVNTTVTDQMPTVVAGRVSSEDPEKAVFNQIMIGVIVVGGIISFAIIILIIYKKRQKFREDIITKTTVAKSNSYKSNVGCKVDYSNQMLITSDDWEIDHRQLKFASHIGQGAFGKVVTGYYQDERVAIKLVRDCAPISYKEDLLAEIHLMKRIGSHPNIVSMIGACTLAEPICLVMEYAPYGNLQNFLKKCRLEGELTVHGGRCKELNYSIMDEHGGINEGIITPTDMLSFTRQIAMAMEYLADKKYVHRDLAARNILLSYDKIIKVCDFGLSRDIYNDNQYKKLTNGKLPLKWMAIESLRDRIFTTQSDVWSFGILLWEIVTMGASPYPNIALADLYYLLSNHYRMEKPSNCSDELYIIMRQCWLDNPTDRPNFTDLRVQLELLLTRDRNYLELDNINVPLSTPETSSGSPVSDDTASLLAAQALQPQRKSSKDELTIDVCIHDKSVEKLLKKKGDFDAHNITIL